MGFFGKAWFIIHDIAYQDNHVGMLFVAHFHVSLYQFLTDHFSDMKIAHHDDRHAVTLAASFGKGDIYIFDNRIGDNMVSMEHQARNDCYDQEEQCQFRLFPMSRHPSGEPMEEAVAEPEHFQDQ